MNVIFKPQNVSVTSNSSSCGINIGNQITRDYVERDPYTGSYEVTPSSETQTLNTKYLRMIDDVIINPVPSNYGLVTWDGSVITIS